MHLINADVADPTKLNKNSGAEFVNQKQRRPDNLGKNDYEKVACIDGDGDRLIYLRNQSLKPYICNGDKIFAMLMYYIVEKLEVLYVKEAASHCMINTAYANG